MPSFSFVRRCTGVRRGATKAFLGAARQWVLNINRTSTTLVHLHWVSLRSKLCIIPILHLRHQNAKQLCSLHLFLQETRRRERLVLKPGTGRLGGVVSARCRGSAWWLEVGYSWGGCDWFSGFSLYSKYIQIKKNVDLNMETSKQVAFHQDFSENLHSVKFCKTQTQSSVRSPCEGSASSFWVIMVSNKFFCFPETKLNCTTDFNVTGMSFIVCKAASLVLTDLTFLIFQEQCNCWEFSQLRII